MLIKFLEFLQTDHIISPWGVVLLAIGPKNLILINSSSDKCPEILITHLLKLKTSDGKKPYPFLPLTSKKDQEER